jgi:hypothetical protein
VTKLEITAMRLSVRSLHERRSEAQRLEKLMYARYEHLPRHSAQYEGSGLVEIIEDRQSWANTFRAGFPIRYRPMATTTS